MPNKNTNTHCRTIRLTARRILGFPSNRKAVSVVVSAVVLSAGVLALGIAVLFWAYSWGNMTNLQYSKAVTANSQAVAERVGFEYISYSSTTTMLTVDLINCGAANNLSISRVHIWDRFHNYVGTGDYVPSGLTNITDGQPIPNNVLGIGEEGRFWVYVWGPLPSGYYNIRIVTGRGRNFDSSFIVP